MSRFIRTGLILPIAALALAALWVSSLPAIASPALPLTVTVQPESQPQTIIAYIPCLGTRATIKHKFDPVMRVTAATVDLSAPQPRFALPYHVTGSETGRVVIVPLDFRLPTYNGRFASWVSDSSDQRGIFSHSDTFTVIARGSDGSVLTFDETLHVTMDAEGNVDTTFDQPICPELQARAD